jgi:hypothetical protein
MEENWGVLGRQSETKGQRFILHTDWDSLVPIQKTGYKIFTGLSQVSVKVLKDPGGQKEETAPNTSESVTHPLECPRRSSRCKRGNSNLPQQIKGPL